MCGERKNKMELHGIFLDWICTIVCELNHQKVAAYTI